MADLASLAAEYEKPKRKGGGNDKPRLTSGASDLAALAAQHEKQPQRQGPAPPPAETRDTPEEARQRVLRAQGEYKQRKVQERVAAKEPKKPEGYGLVGPVGSAAPPKGARPGLDISGGERREQERKAEKPGTIEVAGSRVRPSDPQYKALAQGQETARRGAEAIIANVGAPLYPLRNVINSLSDATSKVKARHPNWRSYKGAQLQAYNRERRQAVLDGLANSKPWQAFVQGLPGWGGGQSKETPFRPFEIAAKNDPKFRKQIERVGGPGVWDFLASMPADAIPGIGQAKLVGKVAKAGAPLQAAAEKAVPALGRALGSRRAYRTTAETFSKAGAKQEGKLRNVAEAAEDLRQTSQKHVKQGAPIRTKDQTGRTVNRLDQLVADYMEAGSRGARHSGVHGPLPTDEASALSQVRLSAQTAGRGAVDQALAQPARTEAAVAGAGKRGGEVVRGAISDARTAEAAAQEIRRIGATTGRAALDTAIRRGKARSVPVKRAAVSAASPPATGASALDAALAQAGKSGGQAVREAIARPSVFAQAGKSGGAKVRELIANPPPDVAAEAEKFRQSVLDAARGKLTPIIRGEAEKRRGVELGEVAREAGELGIDFEDVKRLGERYRAISEEIGQELVAAGKLSAQAFEELRGFHLPRLYVLRSSSPKEARRYLDALELGGLDQETARELERAIDLRSRGMSGSGGFDPTKERKLVEFEERMSPEQGRIVEGSATPAMTRYVKGSVEEIAETEALREVASNPVLAMPRGSGAPRHWIDEVEVDGVVYNVDPGVKNYLNMRSQPDAWLVRDLRRWNPSAAEFWTKLNKGMRATWMSMPPSAINNAAGNYQLGSAAAALNGARYHLPGYLKAATEWKAFKKSGQADGVLKEALEQTDILAEGGSVLPRSAGQIGSGFGVETLGQKAAALPGKAFGAYSDAMLRDPEKAARFYLYKELRASGKGVGEAARVTRAVMIDYSDVGPLKKFLDQNNILPFLTFPTKAIFQYMNLAARRPDLFQTWTGERLRDLMDTLSDESMARQGKPGTAREKRAAGAVGITSFPIPGRVDSQGQQSYVRSPALAPIAMMAPFGRPDQPMDPIQFIEERGRTALPLFRTPLEMMGNFSTFNKFKPIIEPGSVPGVLGTRDAYANPEAATALGLHGAKAFFPQATAIERMYHAITDTSRYPGMFAPKQSFGEALLQTLTGAAIQEGSADRGKEGLDRAGARAKDEKHAPFHRFSSDYIAAIEAGKVLRNPSYVAKAKEIRTFANGKKHMDAATKKTQDILASDYFTGDDRYKQIRMHLDWVFALADRLKELAVEEGMMGAEAPIDSPSAPG
jgi:hypothetical protein